MYTFIWCSRTPKVNVNLHQLRDWDAIAVAKYNLTIVSVSTPIHIFKKRCCEERLLDSIACLDQLTLQCSRCSILKRWIRVLTETFVILSLATAIASQSRSWREISFTEGIRKHPLDAYIAFSAYHWKCWNKTKGLQSHSLLLFSCDLLHFKYIVTVCYFKFLEISWILLSYLIIFLIRL